MERNKESRRGTAAISGNFSSSRRRSRGSGYRESHGVSEAEDWGNDTVTKDRSNDKDRSSRRRRLSSSNESFRVDRDDIVEGSSDESLDEEQDEEEEVIRRSGGSSRQSSRGKSQWMGSEEVIGVSVPRKARSASAKRLQDCFSAARQSSSSSPARTSAASLSPPSSNASMKASKRMRPTSLKTKGLKTSKVSISESEVEVAQFLFGLTKLQSHPPPPKSDVFQNSPKLDPKHNSPNEDSVSVPSKASSPVSNPVSPPISQALQQHSSSVPVPTVMAPKRKKPRPAQLEDNGNSSTLLSCSSKPSGSTMEGQSSSLAAAATAPVIKVEGDKESHRFGNSSPDSGKNTVVTHSDSSKPDTSLPVSPSCQTSVSKDPQNSEVTPSLSPLEAKTIVSPDIWPRVSVLPTEEKLSDADSKAPINQNDGITQKDTSSSNKDFQLPDVKLDAPKIGGSAAVPEGLRGSRIEIDLMAPPENSCHDDCMPDSIDRCGSLASDNMHCQDADGTATKSKEVTTVSGGLEIEETRVKKHCGSLDREVKIPAKEAAAGAAISEKQLADERKTESNHDGNNLDKASSKLQNPQKAQKSAARQAERPAPPIGIMSSASAPTSMMIPGWPGGLPPFGYNPAGVPSVRGAIPLDANAAIPNAPVVMLSQAQPRPNRCATHLFIARLINYQQQLARLNTFWHTATAAGSAALYGAKPYNMNILPQSDVLLFGSSAIRNPNTTTNNGLATGSVVTINGQNLKERTPNSLTDAHKKPLLLPQSLQQGPACLFPVSQSRAGETKPSSLPDSPGLLSTSGVVAAASATAKFNNLAAATSDPQYLAMLQNNYPFPVPPPYRAHIAQQELQPAAAPFFAGSFYPSQLLQLQSHTLPQMQNHPNSATSQKQHVRPQHGFPTPKPSDSHSTEPETTKNSEDGHDSQSSLAQKKLQVQSFPSNSCFNPNFPIIVTGQGGKQPQQPGDPTLQMGVKGIDVAEPVPATTVHGMLQPDVGHNHYQLSNLSKAPAKTPVSRSSDKSTESSHSPSIGVAGQQQQVVSRAKQAVSSASTAVVTGTAAYADRLSVAYTSPNFPTGAMGFPNVQNPLQWKMQSSQRFAQAGPPGNAIAQSSAAAVRVTNAGGTSGKGVKLPSPALNSNQKVITAGASVSPQVQSPGKTQQLFFSNSEPVQQSGGASSSLSQKRHPETNSMPQPVFPGSLNMRRLPNPQGQSVLTGAGAGGFLVGGGKGAAVYGPLVGGSIAAMAGASYGKSAANLPAKSSEQKPTTA